MWLFETGNDIAFGLLIEDFLLSSMPLTSLLTFLSSVFYEVGGVNPAFVRLALPDGVRISRFPTTDCITTKF